MKKSLKITVLGDVQGIDYHEYIRDCATKLSIEGIAQKHENGAVVIYASGSANSLEDLIDSLYEGTKVSKVKQIFYESFLGDKNFHGVFRIIGDFD